MHEHEWLAEQFEENRGHLQGVAYRLLGSLSEAEDAVQEGWLRLSRSGAEGVENLRGWLTTVVAHVCLDMLRSRKSRREESLETPGSEAAASAHGRIDPEQEAMLADSVGLATLVVLDRLNPAERLAFVLHDVFDVPFEEIARIAGRTPESVRQLASRARRRVRGVTSVSEGQIREQRSLVEGFLAALRAGDAKALVALMTPEFAAQADAVAAPRGLPAGAWRRSLGEGGDSGGEGRASGASGAGGREGGPGGGPARTAVPRPAVHLRGGSASRGWR